MDNVFIVKQVANIVVGASVGTVVSNVVRATMPPMASNLHRVGCLIGSTVLGGVVGVYTTRYVDNVIDSFVELKDQLVSAPKKHFKK